MLIYTSPRLGSLPWLQLTYYGHIRSVNRSAGTCEFSWVVVGDIESGRYLNAANSVISYLYVSGHGEVSCTSHVSYAGAAANRTGPYKWLGAADSIIPISSTQEYITITRVRSTSPTMGSTGIQGSTTINVRIPIPVTSVTNVVNTPYLGSGPSIRHCHYANCIRRTSTSAVIGFDDCAQFSANGAALAGVNQLSALLTVNGSTVTVPVKSWYGSAGSYQTGSTAMFGVSWLDPSYSVSATTTSIPVTRTGSTSINMSSSGIQSWTSVSAHVTIPRFTYMSFSGTTLGSTMTITINSINSNNFHTHTITFNGSTDSASTSKSRTRTLTASTFGPKFSSTSKTLSLPVTVTSYDYQGSLGSYTQNVTITMPESVGAPHVSNLRVTKYDEGIFECKFDFTTAYGATVDDISVTSEVGASLDDFQYELESVDYDTLEGSFKLYIDPNLAIGMDITEERTLTLTLTDSRGFVSDPTSTTYYPSAAFTAIDITSFYYDYTIHTDVNSTAEITVSPALTVTSTRVTSASGFDSMATFNPQGSRVPVLTAVPETNEITSDTLTLTVTDSAGNTDSATLTYTPPYRLSQIYSGDTKVWDIRSGSNTVSAAYYGDTQIFKTFG